MLSYVSSGKQQGQSETAVFAGSTQTHIKRRFMRVFKIPEENWKERARLKANKW